MGSRVLDSIFEEVVSGATAASEDDVTFFSGAVASSDEHSRGLKEIKEGGASSVIASDSLITERLGRVEIQHGWVAQDYVWHFTPYSSSGGWSVSADRVLYAIAQTMNKVIPKTVQVDIFKPMLDWEIKAITFKAKDIRTAWNVNEADLRSLTNTLFSVLTNLK